MKIDMFIQESGKLFIFLSCIFLISLIPLCITSNGLHLPDIDKIAAFFHDLISPQTLTYIHSISGVERPLFPFIFDAFRSSFTIFSLSLLLSLSIALLLACVQQFLPPHLRQLMQTAASFLHTIPDLVYIVSAQLLVVAVYQLTQIRFFRFTGAGEAEAVGLPILVLSIIPTLFLYHTLVNLMEMEWQKPYIELAKSKGISRFAILQKHLLRNVLVQLSYHLKFIIATLLGNLFIVEVLFNNLGLTTFLLSYNQPAIFFISALLLFLPIYSLLKLIEIGLFLLLGKGAEL
ncbi:ABC transporter permease subunit [Terribacillus saccharophilus]|uniref:ABC transporter permease subunit n=1 Tax=Terribacillus saccharophilus TaxID=361277 RepID=UPI0015950DF0|nr:ABC transporter permease subunit [Terribacillus saccharophilus]